MNNAFNEKMFDKQIAYNKEMYQTQLGDQWKFYDDQKANTWKLYEDNKAYQTEMWNKQNEYNDPSAQRARLEAAGKLYYPHTTSSIRFLVVIEFPLVT